MTLDDFRTTIFRSVEAIRRTFKKADDDWAAVLLMITHDDRLQAVMPVFLETEDKKLWPAAVAALFLQHRPKYAAFIASAWTIEVPSGAPLANLTLEMAGAFGLSGHPDRKEILTISVADPQASESWQAPIIRSTLPQLGPWKQLPMQGAEGRFANLLGKGFAAIASTKAAPP